LGIAKHSILLGTPLYKQGINTLVRVTYSSSGHRNTSES